MGFDLLCWVCIHKEYLILHFKNFILIQSITGMTGHKRSLSNDQISNIPRKKVSPTSIVHLSEETNSSSGIILDEEQKKYLQSIPTDGDDPIVVFAWNISRVANLIQIVNNANYLPVVPNYLTQPITIE